MRVALGVAQHFLDAVLEPLGDVVLQSFGLLVDLVPRKAHHLLQVELQQPVVPENLQRHGAARLRERRPLAGLVRQEAELVEPLDMLDAEADETSIACASAPVETGAPSCSSSL